MNISEVNISHLTVVKLHSVCGDVCGDVSGGDLLDNPLVWRGRGKNIAHEEHSYREPSSTAHSAHHLGR